MPESEFGLNIKENRTDHLSVINIKDVPIRIWNGYALVLTETLSI